MKAEELKQLSNELIDRYKWTDSLGRFVEVLRINIFVVDCTGQVIIPPVHDRDNRGIYGACLLNPAFNFDLTSPAPDILKKFKQHGPYLEARGLFDLCAFAIPIKIEGENIIAYMVVGPVILNRRWDNDVYVQAASGMNFEMDNFTDIIHEIRVVSFITIRAVLDLLAQIARDIIDLSLENKKLYQKRFNKEILPENLRAAVQDMYANIHMDELLVTVLDVALNFTGAECGSIMLRDKDKEELTIRVARGIDKEKMSAKLKFGEGIAGIAAQENRSFVISGARGEGRIKHLLKRPEIKQSAVIPLSIQNRVFGVLNLHTEKEDGRIEIDENNLQHLSRLVSTALNNS